MDTKKCTKATPEEALEYPGVAVNEADNDKNTPKLHKQATCELNNNPRNDDM